MREIVPARYGRMRAVFVRSKRMAEAAAVTLTVVTGEDQRRYVFDERTTCVLGRAADCDPRLPDDERHRKVSRHHCLIDINPPDALCSRQAFIDPLHLNKSHYS
jgi:hypothetical protein